MPPTRPIVKLVGERLVSKGIITQEQLDKTIQKQKNDPRPIGEILLSDGTVTETQLVEALSEQLGIPFVDVEFYEVDQAILGLFPKTFLTENVAIPLFRTQKTVTVAMADPLDIRVIDRLRMLGKCEIEPVFSTATAITRLLERFFGAGDSLERVIEEVGRAAPAGPARGTARPGARAGQAADAAEGLAAAAEQAPIVKLVDTVLKQAVSSRASDIHIEPDEEVCRLRYRVDGVLYEAAPPPKRLEAAVISRLKIMAGLDIAERRLPQDGRLHLKFGDREVDFRISTFPTIHGENVVIRVLDKSSDVLSLEQIGFQPEILKKFKQLIGRPHGILLVTGPTGCGKTTTLYSVLRIIDAVQRNVITLEDPVEYRISRIRQSQIDVKAGLTFASGLRSIVRQDPDVIMIGEIRDLETAEIAIHAALTGHLVFSTLHTNDAPGAVTRLIDMGVEPFLISSSVIGVVAQRLVRTLCPKCRKPQAATPELAESLGLKAIPPKAALSRAGACEECKQSGYRGRTGIFELLEMSEPLRALTVKKSSLGELRAQAMKDGMISLHQAGVAKALEGLTTIEEILRVTEYALEE